MKTTNTLKNELIERIKNSQDSDFLNALKIILDTSENIPYKLTSNQEKAIQLGREEIKIGEFIENSQVMEKARQWLEKK
jgi:hypothetical protein